MTRLTGLVLRSQGGVYTVETAQGVCEAVLRGRVKREERLGDRVVVGDRVELRRGEAGEAARWTIESVAERSSALVRRAPGRAVRPKVIAANVDQVVIVFAVANPAPHLRMLDRYLVLCESAGIEPLIVINKTDLAGDGGVLEQFDAYGAIGYRLIHTSVPRGTGVDALRAALARRISALSGPSGVGKSSLLNAVQPGLGLRVGAVGAAAGKGRHTTVTAELIPLEGGGYVADTPGLRELGLWDVPIEELDHYFPEFLPYLESCRYGNSCSHSHEPTCAVREAVETGEIGAERYASYLRMLAGDDDGGAED